MPAGVGPDTLAGQCRALQVPQRLNVTPWVHPFLSAVTPLAYPSPSLVFQCRLTTTPRLSYLQDHVVLGRPLLPAAAMLELALATLALATSDAAAQEGLVQVQDMAIMAPVVMASPHADSAVTVACQLDLATGQLVIRSCLDAEQAAAGKGWSVSATAQAGMLESPYLEPGTSTPLHVTAQEAALTAALVQLFPPLAAELAAAAAADACGSISSLQEEWHADGYFTRPQQVDSAFHLGVTSPDAGAKVPTAVRSFLSPLPRGSAAAPAGEVFAATAAPKEQQQPAAGRRQAGPAATSEASFYMTTAAGSTTGSLVAVVEGLQTRVLTASQARQLAASAAVGAAHPATSKEGEAAACPCSYNMEWQACMPEGESTGTPCLYITSHKQHSVNGRTCLLPQSFRDSSWCSYHKHLEAPSYSVAQCVLDRCCVAAGGAHSYTASAGCRHGGCGRSQQRVGPAATAGPGGPEGCGRGARPWHGPASSLQLHAHQRSRPSSRGVAAECSNRAANC
jgi:hypothetical protein